jgi:hypothetical protein
MSPLVLSKDVLLSFSLNVKMAFFFPSLPINLQLRLHYSS